MLDLSLNEEKIKVAVKTLLKISEAENVKDVFGNEGIDIEIQLAVKKIPNQEKRIKLNLPNSLHQTEQEVCIFVKDLKKDKKDFEPTVHHYQDLLRKHGVSNISEIIPLKALKTEYKPFEAKRNLSMAYHTFLADERIVRLLPTYLGKHFYGKNKNPVQVNLSAKDLKGEITKAVNGSRCVVSSKGSSSLCTVGHSKQSQEEIVENVIFSAGEIARSLPGGGDNVKQLSLKTKASPSIPIYLSKGGPQDIKLPDKEKKGTVEAEEISTLFGAKVKVFPNGHIEVISNSKKHSKSMKRKLDQNKNDKVKPNKKQKVESREKKPQNRGKKGEKNDTKAKGSKKKITTVVRKKVNVKKSVHKIKSIKNK